MVNCSPLATLIWSKTMASSDWESPLERAVTSVRCPVTFTPRGTRVPFVRTDTPAVLNSTMSPCFSLLEQFLSSYIQEG